MSDITSQDNAEQITSKQTRKPKSDKHVAFSSCHVTYATAKGIDVTRAAKLNRSYVRANFDALVKVWPELKASQKKNRDANRYPATLPTSVAKQITSRSIKQSA